MKPRAYSSDDPATDHRRTVVANPAHIAYGRGYPDRRRDADRLTERACRALGLTKRPSGRATREQM